MHIVNDNCVKCKYTDCVEVCPVDCFYEGEDMLVINPMECIDCGLCIKECPVKAIFFYDDSIQDPNLMKFLEINSKYSLMWPQITKKQEPHKDVEKYKDVKNKAEIMSKKPAIKKPYNRESEQIA